MRVVLIIIGATAATIFITNVSILFRQIIGVYHSRRNSIWFVNMLFRNKHGGYDATEELVTCYRKFLNAIQAEIGIVAVTVAIFFMGNLIVAAALVVVILIVYFRAVYLYHDLESAVAYNYH